MKRDDYTLAFNRLNILIEKGEIGLDKNELKKMYSYTLRAVDGAYDNLGFPRMYVAITFYIFFFFYGFLILIYESLIFGCLLVIVTYLIFSFGFYMKKESKRMKGKFEKVIDEYKKNLENFNIDNPQT